MDGTNPCQKDGKGAKQIRTICGAFFRKTQSRNKNGRRPFFLALQGLWIQVFYCIHGFFPGIHADHAVGSGVIVPVVRC